MNSFNDIVDEKYKVLPINDNDGLAKTSINREQRTDSENEALADYLLNKLGTTNKLPLLAVGYSGIPRDTINRHLTTAIERTKTSPIRLFMHLISQEAQWKNYQKRKAERDEVS